MHIHNSCLLNSDKLDLLIKTAVAHEQRILQQTIINTCEKYEREGIETQSKITPVETNGGCFHDYKSKLFNGKSILEFRVAPFPFIFVVLSCLTALFALFSA